MAVEAEKTGGGGGAWKAGRVIIFPLNVWLRIPEYRFIHSLGAGLCRGMEGSFLEGATSPRGTGEKAEV